MGLLDWLKKAPNKQTLQEDDDYAVYAKLSKESGQAMTEEEAVMIREKVLADLKESTSKAMNFACKLLMDAQYEPSIIAFETILQHVPSKRGTCENQIGAAYYFLENYTKAVEYYLKALEHGFDRSMLDFNIAEAAEAYYKETNHVLLAGLYMEHFPEGAFINEIKVILDSKK